jgi:hypothetical protein
MSAALFLALAPPSAALVGLDQEPAAAGRPAPADFWAALVSWFAPWVPVTAADSGEGDGDGTGSSDSDRSPSMDPDGLAGGPESNTDRSPSMDPDG